MHQDNNTRGTKGNGPSQPLTSAPSQTTQPHTTQSQTTQPSATQPQTTQPQTTQPQTTQPQTTQSQTTQSQTTQPQTTQTVGRDGIPVRRPDSQSREPGFKSHCGRFEPLASLITPHCHSSLSCINEYLAIQTVLDV